jgi:hypothetical protein
MQLKELCISIMNMRIFDLDLGHFVNYESKYDDYYIAQIFADDIDNNLCVCIDLTKNKY